MNWNGIWAIICARIKGLELKLQVNIVKWQLPPSGRLKLNTNGSSKELQKTAWIGGIV